MPAPRALLRDIAAQGLDPNVAYYQIGKDGHIRDHRKPAAKPPVVVAPHKPVAPPPPAPKPAPPAPKVEVEVKVETKDGVEQEKVDVTVGDLKIEVEVPVVSDEKASAEDKKDAELPVIPEGTEEVVLASSKKNKAKKPDPKVEAPKPVEKKEEPAKATEAKKADEKPAS